MSIFTAVLAPVALAVVLFTAVWWCVGRLLAAAYPALRGRVQALPACRRLRVLSVLSALPILCALILTALLFIPPAGDVLVSGHCHDGIGCHAHAPAIGNALLGGVLLGLALLIAGGGALRAHGLLRRHRWRRQQLRQLAQPAPEGGYWLIDCEPAFAVTAGLLRQEIFVSTGLVQQLDAAHLASVLAHERAHMHWRDNLFLALNALCAPASLTGRRSALAADLRGATEERADGAAANAVDDPLLVAEALIRSQRLQTSRARGASGSSSLPARVVRLVEEPMPAGGTAPWLVIGLSVLLLVGGLLGVNIVHHATEALLGSAR